MRPYSCQIPLHIQRSRPSRTKRLSHIKPAWQHMAAAYDGLRVSQSRGEPPSCFSSCRAAIMVGFRHQLQSQEQLCSRIGPRAHVAPRQLGYGMVAHVDGLTLGAAGQESSRRTRHCQGRPNPGPLGSSGSADLWLGQHVLPSDQWSLGARPRRTSRDPTDQLGRVKVSGLFTLRVAGRTDSTASRSPHFAEDCAASRRDLAAVTLRAPGRRAARFGAPCEEHDDGRRRFAGVQLR